MCDFSHNGDECIECPFHKWKFGSDGTIKDMLEFSFSEINFTNFLINSFFLLHICIVRISRTAVAVTVRNG